MSTAAPTTAAGGFPADLVRLLTEIGYFAAGSGRTAQALAIMEGLKAMRPGRSAAYIGIALAHMNAGRPAEAARVLREEALPAVAPDEADAARVFLALALHLDGRPRECAEALDLVPADSADADAVKLAKTLREAL
ncbi:MAG: tetratricopeptide repeat protein [Rhodospirillales bacterium]|nr:tetratricopeptide repeat protein [Rhodospirillales bacterium]